MKRQMALVGVEVSRIRSIHATAVVRAGRDETPEARLPAPL